MNTFAIGFAVVIVGTDSVFTYIILSLYFE